MPITCAAAGAAINDARTSPAAKLRGSITILPAGCSCWDDLGTAPEREPARPRPNAAVSRCGTVRETRVRTPLTRLASLGNLSGRGARAGLQCLWLTSPHWGE